MLGRPPWLRVIISIVLFLSCSAIAFSQGPTLTSISPTAVAPGMQVTFTGSGFGVATGGVYFGNGAYGAVVSWSDTQVVATVPGPGSGLAPGKVDVCQSGVCSNQVAFTVLPSVLTSISPTAIAPGMQVTFTGSGFGATQGYGGIYFGNGAYGTVVSWSDTQIVATVPGPGSGLLPGNVDIYQDGVYSNAVAFSVVPPVLTSISPTAVAPGMQVTFTGSGFGATEGQGCVYFGNGAYGTVVSWSDTQIVATVPSARLTPGNVAIYQDGVYSNTVAFSVVPSVLTSISPTEVAPGMQVTFTGSGFGATQGQGGLYFGNGAYGTVVSWSDTQIVATVPSSRLTPGNVAIYQNGVYSNTVAFTVVPSVLTSISPTAVAPGMQVTFTGSGFGATQGQGGLYFGNGAYGTVVSWNDTQIVATVPSSRLTPGNVAIYQNGVYSNTVAFTVVPPVLTSISPTAVAPGMQVAFTGSGFGTTQGQGCVYFGNGAYGTVGSWSDTQIVATVPSSRLTPGNVAIYQNGVYSNDVVFTVVPSPSVSALSPTSGSIGTSITITGASFGATQGTSTVSFNGTISTPTSWSDTSITVPVPSGATIGPVIVTISGLAVTGPAFTVNASVAPVLKLRINDSPGLVNLSDPANTDWVAWGATGSISATRKSGANLISDFSALNGASVSADLFSFVQFSWTGGVPIASETADTPEVRVGGAGSPGFQITVPADTTVKTLNIFAGVNGTAELDASISDGSSAAITDTSVSSLGEADKTYSIDFRAASPGQTLTIQLKSTDPNGYLELQAATLQPHLPEVSIASPTQGQSFSLGTDIPVGVNATQYDSGISSVEITDNSAQIFNMTTPPYSTTLSGAPSGHHQLGAGATDSNGLSNASQPIAIDVISSGGTLTASLGQVTGTVDLSAEGTGDWKLFSPLDPSVGRESGDSKANVISQISNYTILGNHTSSLLSSCGPESFSFENGTPDSSASNVNPCVYEDGLGNGFQFTVAADTAPRTLRVYLVADYGVVKLQAYLSDGSAVPIADTSLNNQNAATATVYTINYSAASANQILTVLFTLDQQYDWGDLELYAATLSGAADWTVVPNISSLSPAQAAVGELVTINGSNFGSDSGTVTFNGIVASGCLWANTSIQCHVPEGTTSGPIVVTTAVGSPSNNFAFTVLSAPIMTSISPSSGLAGSVVTILGSNFGTMQGTSTVSFNGTLATPSNWSDTSITVPVPNGATTGPVVVAVSGEPPAGINFAVGNSETFNTGRFLHSATFLDNGKVLIAGGVSCSAPGSCIYLNTAEIYDPSTGTSTETGNMATARSAPAVLLPNGKVLIAGGSYCDTSENCNSLYSAELYDPSTGIFSSAGAMTSARDGHTMTLLQNGQVLIAGGENCTPRDSSELRFRSYNAHLLPASFSPSTGISCSALSSAEIYDPTANTFTQLPSSLQMARYNAAATRLESGKVLVVGGSNETQAINTVELYDPVANSFTLTQGSLNVARSSPDATLLNGGQVLVTGGSTCDLNCPTLAAELYDPASDTFSSLGGMTVPRVNHTATLLTNGQVLIAGGFNDCASSPCVSDSSTELYDPVAKTFDISYVLSGARAYNSATLLSDGSVLLAGGVADGVSLSSMEFYVPSTLLPPGLTSIAIAPAAPSLIVGTSQSVSAVGTFNDGSTQTLHSVQWSSATPEMVAATANVGVISAVSVGTSSISATLVSLSGSTTVTVPSLVSISVTPSNPSLTLGAAQQFTALGTFSDGTTHDVTTLSTWNSSPVTVLSMQNIQNVPAIGVAIGAGNATVTASLWNITGSDSVTVVPAPAPPVAPNITSISPTSGAVGTQVTVTGSGFGATQNSGIVWLGTSPGSVVSWSDGQIVATVVPGATSGSVQVQQSGVGSNAVNFSISAPVISTVSPSNGLAGTQVTISGSGFGATQSSGQVWLGSVPGVVQNWSDTQITATVGLGAVSGFAQVLQNGVLSNSVPFTINFPHITSVSPTSGLPGTTITINGSGFGSSQGSGNIWLGSTWGAVTNWSDTQIVAVVASNSTNGTVRVTQNGYWSNAVMFNVPVSYSLTGVSLVPHEVSMVVGDTRTLRAIDSQGTALTGLAWKSSDTTIASLSTDDPPVITALAPGHSTISAGDGSADITVYPGSALPIGTIQWSNPGDGSGVTKITPAVPSENGVADVFAFQADGSVQAIASDGTVAWTAFAQPGSAIPDFQGGLIIHGGPSINKIDGITGQGYPTYTVPADKNNEEVAPASIAVHTDGTIFSVEEDSVAGINPLTGTAKFRIPVKHSTFTQYSGNEIIINEPNNPPTWTSNIIVAGDGFAYVPYEYENQVITDSGRHDEIQLRVLRIGTDGSSSDILVKDWTKDSNSFNVNTGTVPYGPIWCDDVCQAAGGWLQCENTIGCAGHVLACTDNTAGFCTVTTSVSIQTGPDISLTLANLITNADQGALLSVNVNSDQFCALSTQTSYIPPPNPVVNSGCQPSSKKSYVAVVSSDGSVSFNESNIPSPNGPIQPVLQAQDGTYFGTMSNDTGQQMIHFNASGGLLNVGGDYQPAIATADGGLIATTFSGTAVTMDASLNITGMAANVPIQTWNANMYQYGSTDQVLNIPASIATSFWAFAGGNASGSGTAAVLYSPPQIGLRTIASTNLTAQPACSTLLDNLTAIAITNGRDPLGPSLTKAALITEIQRTATGAVDYIADGPSSNTSWDQCTPPNCVAKFPVWMTGEQKPDGYTVGQEFADNPPGTFHQLDGLSQYNGYTIWLRFFSDWTGGWKGLFSPFIVKMGQVNSYGLGTLLHEALHKQSIGGGFSHGDMSQALGISSCSPGTNHNACSDLIGQRCFPQ